MDTNKSCPTINNLQQLDEINLNEELSTFDELKVNNSNNNKLNDHHENKLVQCSFTCSSSFMAKTDLDESLVVNEVIIPTKYHELLPPPTNSKLYRAVNHLVFRLLTLLLIITDCILTIIDILIDLTLNRKPIHLQNVFDSIALLFVIIFVVEVLIRIYATGLDQFFIDWYNCVDFVVIIMSFIVTIIYIAMNYSHSFAKLIVLARLIRAMRLIRLIRVVLTEPKNIQKGVRHVVSENKRRYRGDGFDLDLTYVTPRIIGMSFPSIGTWAYYRNNIKDVAKFFTIKHGIDNYKVYNLCAEKNYDPAYFQGRVSIYPIDDHNVPSLFQMMEFVKDVKEWLEQDERHVVAVHCKGGKGRTGTMICAYLIYDGFKEDFREVLNYFAEQRTDLSVGKKYQGVETPSQARYVGYFARVINELGGKIPPKREFNFKSINIEGIAKVGAGNGSDISCSMIIDRDEVYNMDFGTETNCTTFYNQAEDILIITPINCPILRGDVRVKFDCRSKRVPKAYESCAFYFWFNTAFVEGNSLTLDREELDNPHKQKTWKIYTDKFKVSIYFSPSPSSPSSSTSIA